MGNSLEWLLERCWAPNWTTEGGIILTLTEVETPNYLGTKVSYEGFFFFFPDLQGPVLQELSHGNIAKSGYFYSLLGCAILTLIQILL